MGVSKIRDYCLGGSIRETPRLEAFIKQYSSNDTLTEYEWLDDSSLSISHTHSLSLSLKMSNWSSVLAWSVVRYIWFCCSSDIPNYLPCGITPHGNHKTLQVSMIPARKRNEAKACATRLG